MSSFPRPFFNTFKHIGRNWFRRSSAEYMNAKPHFEFTVASYNVLADQLLHEHPHLYFNNNTHEPWVFDWNYRKKNLIAEIAYSNVDILCLQEVQEEHYYNWFHPQLREYGYTGVYKKRSGDKHDGCATFFKQSLFAMESYKLIDFYHPNSTFMDRNNVAILVILNPISKDLKDRSPICIGNTHLLFNKKRGDIKLAQLAHLFAEIDRCAKDTSNKSNFQSRMPTILCGDFNSTPFSPLYDFITKGELMFQGTSKALISGQSTDDNGRNRKSKFEDKIFSADLGLTHTCKWSRGNDNNSKRAVETSDPTRSHQKHGFIDLTAENDNKHTTLRERPGVLSHDLNFKSCYMHRGIDGTPEVTTCHDRACSTVDYILYTSDVREGEQSHERLRLSGVLSLLSEIELQRMGKLPNKEVSSDHLFLMSSFVLS